MAFNHDLLAILYEVEELRQLSLGAVYADQFMIVILVHFLN